MLESLAFHSNHLEMVTPFASAPVRSKPRRTYDPASPTPDPEGDYVPMYLADLFLQDRERWNSLKKRLESFGSASGLFDEISIRQLGERGSEPFQVQIRKFDGRQEGPPRNLIDVGYGVSQVLPVITELLIAQERKMFLLQQPEVHLHPSAQAALGSLFCQVAAEGHQIVVETHSDYLLDRVRMEVRDGTADLRPNDVSILYFEARQSGRKDSLDTHGRRGQHIGAPDSYRSFFMEGDGSFTLEAPAKPGNVTYVCDYRRECRARGVWPNAASGRARILEVGQRRGGKNRRRWQVASGTHRRLSRLQAVDERGSTRRTDEDCKRERSRGESRAA